MRRPPKNFPFTFLPDVFFDYSWLIATGLVILADWLILDPGKPSNTKLWWAIIGEFSILVILTPIWFIPLTIISLALAPGALFLASIADEIEKLLPPDK